MNVKQLMLMAMLTALSVVGRIFLSAIPNIQPVTVTVVISSFILRPAQAILVTCAGVFISNLFLGMGTWTIWQMLIWSLIGLMSGVIGKYRNKIPLLFLSLYAGFCGLFYGFMISIPNAILFDINFWTYYLLGLPFDLGHAVGNVIFFTIFYPIFFKILGKHIDKYKK